MLALPASVPVVCVHGVEDAHVPVDQSERFVAASVRSGGVAARLVKVAGEAHFEALDPRTEVHRQTVLAVQALLAG